MRISDWSSDVCSSDLHVQFGPDLAHVEQPFDRDERRGNVAERTAFFLDQFERMDKAHAVDDAVGDLGRDDLAARSEEHTSELQSLMRNSYAVFCLKKKMTAPDSKTETVRSQKIRRA